MCGMMGTQTPPNYDTTEHNKPFYFLHDNSNLKVHHHNRERGELQNLIPRLQLLFCQLCLFCVLFSTTERPTTPTALGLYRSLVMPPPSLPCMVLVSHHVLCVVPLCTVQLKPYVSPTNHLLLTFKYTPACLW